MNELNKIIKTLFFFLITINENFKLYKIILLSIGIFFMSFHCHAAVINVPSDYATIQQAIYAANTGDIVYVAPGTYYENVLMKDGVHLIGAGADMTIIDASQHGDVVNACVNNATISGFTLTNSGDYKWLGHYSCGVYIRGNYSPSVIYNVIINNEKNGVGIWDGANPDIRNNIIKNNFDGIYIYGDAQRPCNPIIINNIIVNNVRSGILLREWVSPTILNNIIIGHKDGWWSSDGQYYFSSSGIDYSFVKGSPRLGYNNLWDNDINYQNTVAGPGAISANPLFADPNTNDYHLLPNSPCIDIGDPNDICNDIDGTRNDMGVYGGPLGNQSDIDGDGVLNNLDNCLMVFNPYQSDLDGDGIGNLCDDDIDGDGYPTSQDCNNEDHTIYPGAPGTHEGTDNNCNGIIDEDEKRQTTYPTYTPMLSSGSQYQQLWRLSFLPLYLERQSQIWYEYQYTLYQQQLIKTISSRNQFWFSITQPYWHQPYLQWYFVRY